MAKNHLAFSVNGEQVEVLAETCATLLDVLRDDLQLTGTKEGCGTGDCGACSVTVDGRLVCACLMLGIEAQGRDIGTIEGLAKTSANGEALHPLQQKFLEHAASARRASWSPPKRCSTGTRILRKPKSATGSPAISAAAPATTKSSAP
jgi:aerobic-type carbon monoxide dehydrogenase small subunit (CoxS/CutS family)